MAAPWTSPPRANEGSLPGSTLLARAEAAFAALHEGCRRRDYRGSDPYDGLTSPIADWFDHLPGRRLFRLGWIQFFKHFPIDLRPLVGIAPLENAKGLALFGSGLLARHRARGLEEDLEEARRLGERLLALTAPSGGGWGYPFPWEGRRHSLPAGRPNLVVTSFVSEFLLDLADETGENRWTEPVERAIDFVLRDLVVVPSGDRRGLAYFPTPPVFVHNANLLGAALLARTGHHELASEATDLSVASQHADGSWAYGPATGHRFVDCFHTAYNLLALESLRERLDRPDLEGAIERGTQAWIDTFFRDGNALPLFERDRLYPIDTHNLAVSLLTLLALAPRIPTAGRRADRLLASMLTRMVGSRGTFHFRRYRFGSNPASPMRWTQAWAHLALAAYLECRGRDVR